MGFQITYEDFITINIKHQFVYKKDEDKGICTDINIHPTKATEKSLADFRLKLLTINGGIKIYNKTNKNGTSLSKVIPETALYFHLTQVNPDFSSYTDPFFANEELNNKIYFFTNFNRGILTNDVGEEASSSSDFITLVSANMELDLPANTIRINFISRGNQIIDHLFFETKKTGQTSIDVSDISEGVYTKLQFFDENDNLLSNENRTFYKQSLRPQIKILGLIELFISDFTENNYNIIFKKRITRWLYLLGHNANYNVGINWSPNTGGEAEVYQDNISFNVINIPQNSSNSTIQKYQEMVISSGVPFDGYVLTALASNNAIPASDLPKTGINARLTRSGQIAAIEINNLSNPDIRSLTKVQNEDFLTYFMMIPKNYQN